MYVCMYIYILRHTGDTRVEALLQMNELCPGKDGQNIEGGRTHVNRMGEETCANSRGVKT